MIDTFTSGIELMGKGGIMMYPIFLASIVAFAIIIDDQLDKKSGLDIINQMSGKLCKKVIYLASRPFLAASMELQNLDIYEWVTKPVDPLKLAVVVCDYFVEVANKQHALRN